MNPQDCHVSELPDDLQVLISDFVEDSLGEWGLGRLKSHGFRIRRVPVSAFPRVKMWTDYRDRAYAEAMIGRALPPILLCGDQWLDGRNRVWASRRAGKIAVDCIDLAEIGVRVGCKALGKLRCKHPRLLQRIIAAVKASGWNAIVLSSEHPFMLNERRMSELHSIGWDGGAAEFKASLRDQILVPARRAHYPDPDYLVFGQQLRGWAQKHLV